MPIRSGDTNVSSVFLGVSSVNSVRLGSTKIFPSGGYVVSYAMNLPYANSREVTSSFGSNESNPSLLYSCKNITNVGNGQASAASTSLFDFLGFNPVTDNIMSALKITIDNAGCRPGFHSKLTSGGWMLPLSYFDLNTPNPSPGTRVLTLDSGYAITGTRDHGKNANLYQAPIGVYISPSGKSVRTTFGNSGNQYIPNLSFWDGNTIISSLRFPADSGSYSLASMSMTAVDRYGTFAVNAGGDTSRPTIHNIAANTYDPAGYIAANVWASGVAGYNPITGDGLIPFSSFISLYRPATKTIFSYATPADFLGAVSFDCSSTGKMVSLRQVNNNGDEHTLCWNIVVNGDRSITYDKVTISTSGVTSFYGPNSIAHYPDYIVVTINNRIVFLSTDVLDLITNGMTVGAITFSGVTKGLTIPVPSSTTLTARSTLGPNITNSAVSLSAISALVSLNLKSILSI